MQAPKTLFGRALAFRWIANSLVRRVTLAVLALIFLGLSFFPRYYHASVQIIEPTSNAAGLSAVLGQLGGNYAALLSTGQSYEVNLAVGRTYLVERDVIRDMRLLGQPGFETLDTAVRTLRKLVTVRSMRGGIIALEVASRDDAFALKLVTQYARNYSSRLAQLAREQTAYKRQVLNGRMREAAARLARSQGALDRFRQRYRIPSLDTQLGSSVEQLAGLRGRVREKQVELQTARQFFAPGSMRVRALQSEIGSLESQIRDEQGRQGSVGELTATGLVRLSNQYDNLVRDVTFAQTLYQAYTRYLEGSAVEELSAAWNLQQLEPPYIHPGHQVNKIPLALLVMVLLAGIAAEVYLIFPPRGARREIADAER